MMYSLEIRRVRVMIVAGEADVAERNQWSFVDLQHEVFSVSDGIARANVRVPVLAIVEFQEKRQIVGSCVFQTFGLDFIERVEERIVEVARGERRHPGELDRHVPCRGRGCGALLVTRMEQRAHDDTDERQRCHQQAASQPCGHASDPPMSIAGCAYQRNRMRYCRRPRRSPSRPRSATNW